MRRNKSGLPRPMVGVKTFLVTLFGKPYTAPGFSNWF
jgi:hypothetical protein